MVRREPKAVVRISLRAQLRSCGYTIRALQCRGSTTSGEERDTDDGEKTTDALVGFPCNENNPCISTDAYAKAAHVRTADAYDYCYEHHKWDTSGDGTKGNFQVW